MGRSSPFDIDLVTDLCAVRRANRQLDGAFVTDKERPKTPRLDTAQDMRYAVVFTDVNNVEWNAHEPHVDAAPGPKNQPAARPQFAPPHQSNEAGPVVIGKLGALGEHAAA